MYARQERYKTAQPLFEQAFAIRKNSLGNRHPSYATSLNNLGYLKHRLNLYEEAIALYEEALDILGQNIGENISEYLTTTDNLAELYEIQGKYSKAASMYQEVIFIKEQVIGKEHPAYAVSLNNLASFYTERGLYASAESLLQKALYFHKKNAKENHPNYIIYSGNLAEVFKLQGREIEAMALFEQSLAKSKEVLGEDNPTYIDILANYSSLLEQYGLYKKAEVHTLKVLKVLKGVVGEKHLKYATVLNNLAIIYMKQGLYEKAEKTVQKSLSIKENNIGTNNSKYAISLYNLASIYEYKQNYKEAEKLYQKVLELDSKTFGELHPSYALSLGALASYYNKRGEYVKAETLVKKALKIQKETLSEEHIDYIRSLNMLSISYYKQGLYDKSKPLFYEIIKKLPNQITLLLPTLSENNRQKFLHKVHIFFNNFYDFSSKYYSKIPAISSHLLDLRLEIKGLLFQSFQKMQRQILASNDSTLINKYHTWKDKRSYLAKVYEMSSEQKKKQGIDENELQEATNQLEKQLSQESQKYAGIEELSKFHNKYTWKEAQKYLKKGEILIEVIRAKTAKDSVSYLMILLDSKMSKYPEMIVLDNGNDLETQHIAFYRKNINTQTKESQSYQVFWAKIEATLQKRGNIRKIYFSPDGVYNQINLLTLASPENNQYLMDKYEIQLLGSPKDFLINTQKTESSPLLKDYEIALFGYPLYSPFPVQENNNNTQKSLALGMQNRVNLDSTQRFLKGGKKRLLTGTKK